MAFWCDKSDNMVSRKHYYILNYNELYHSDILISYVLSRNNTSLVRLPPLAAMFPSMGCYTGPHHKEQKQSHNGPTSSMPWWERAVHLKYPIPDN